jgi:hypothetical protein
MSEFEKYNFRWDDANGIAYGKTVGELDEIGAHIILREVERFSQEHGGQIDWIIDFAERTGMSSKARKIAVKAITHPSIRKIAIVGASTFTRTVIKFIISAAGTDKVMLFATENDAVRWIKKTRNDG